MLFPRNCRHWGRLSLSDGREKTKTRNIFTSPQHVYVTEKLIFKDHLLANEVSTKTSSEFGAQIARGVFIWRGTPPVTFISILFLLVANIVTAFSCWYQHLFEIGKPYTCGACLYVAFICLCCQVSWIQLQLHLLWFQLSALNGCIQFS